MHPTAVKAADDLGCDVGSAGKKNAHHAGG